MERMKLSLEITGFTPLFITLKDEKTDEVVVWKLKDGNVLEFKEVSEGAGLEGPEGNKE